jgi:hypothetical protein
MPAEQQAGAGPLRRPLSLGVRRCPESFRFGRPSGAEPDGFCPSLDENNAEDQPEATHPASRFGRLPLRRRRGHLEGQPVDN